MTAETFVINSGDVVTVEVPAPASVEIITLLGPTGIQGAQGDQGIQGPTGPPGPAGAVGAIDGGNATSPGPIVLDGGHAAHA